MRGRSFTALSGRTFASLFSDCVAGCAGFGAISVSAGASAIASIGSRSGSGLKMATLIAPATNPQTTKATNVRQTLEVPIYPNSGCNTRTWGTQQTVFTPRTPTLSIHNEGRALAQNTLS
jgi:hypothetical protein